MIRLGFVGAGPMPVQSSGFTQVKVRVPVNGMTNELLAPFIRKQKRELQSIKKALYESMMREGGK